MSKCGVIKCHGQSCPSSEESDTDEPWTRGQTTSQLSQVSRTRKRVASISGGRRTPDRDSCGYGQDSRCHPDCDTSQTWYSKLLNSVNGSWLSFKKYLGVRNGADLYNLLYYKFYNDRYRWELFKSILWFTIGIKLFSDIGRHLISVASDGSSEVDGVSGVGGAAGALGGGAAGAIGGGAAGDKGYRSTGGYDGDGGGADGSEGGGWAAIKRLCKPKKPVIEPC